MSAASYRYEFVDCNAFFADFVQHRQAVFLETNDVNLADIHSAEEMTIIEDLRKKSVPEIRLCLVVYDGDRVIGWSLGEQERADCFYMRNSAVYPEYRRQGIYRTMLKMMVDKVVSLGFQKIMSRHHATNNAVLIPKMQAGFMISGMEISDRYGLLVFLVYYPHPRRADLLRYRAGALREF